MPRAIGGAQAADASFVSIRTIGKLAKFSNFPFSQVVERLVGAVRFELTTTGTPCRYATRLRYAPRGRIISGCTRAPSRLNCVDCAWQERARLIADFIYICPDRRDPSCVADRRLRVAVRPCREQPEEQAQV